MIEQAAAARFGANLRAERARVGLSQDALGRRARVHRTQISLMESGLRLPRLDTLVKLACALGIRVDVLVEGIVFKPVVIVGGGFEVETRPGSLQWEVEEILPLDPVDDG